MIFWEKITKILALFLILETSYSSQGLIDLNDRPSNDGVYDSDYLRDPPALATDQSAMEYFEPQDYVENNEKGAVASDSAAAAVAGDCEKEQNLDSNEIEEGGETKPMSNEVDGGGNDSKEEIDYSAKNEGGDAEEEEQEEVDASLNLQKRRIPQGASPKIMQITFDPKNFNERVLKEALGEESMDRSVRGIPHCSPEEAEREKAEFVKRQEFDRSDSSYLQRDNYLEVYDGESEGNEPTESGYLLKKLLGRLRRTAASSSGNLTGELCLPPQPLPEQQCHCSVPTTTPKCTTTRCSTTTTCRTTTKPCSSICPNKVGHINEHTTIVQPLNSMAKSHGSGGQTGLRKRHVDDTLQPLLRQIVRESAAKADAEAESDDNTNPRQPESARNQAGQWYFSGKDNKKLERYLSDVMQSSGGLNDNSLLMSILKQLADNQSTKQALNEK